MYDKEGGRGKVGFTGLKKDVRRRNDTYLEVLRTVVDGSRIEDEAW